MPFSYMQRVISKRLGLALAYVSVTNNLKFRVPIKMVGFEYKVSEDSFLF